MCGIAGWVGHSSKQPGIPDKILQALNHRGPDAQGMRQWDYATLLHTRLSILDLTPTGSQPMANEDDSVLVILNGEIYNHNELRKVLMQKGHKFRGRSDTEVIPHLYEEYGDSFINHLRGMFALALWDTCKKRMILARDRFGIKPLFFAPSYKRLAFASELGALLCLPDLDRRPNRQAISDYAALLYIPAPLTFYTGIQSLRPCEALLAAWTNDKIEWKTWLYHQWKVTPDFGLDFDHAVDNATELIYKAVASQLQSDVPLGTLLSGGIDSSLVTAAAQNANTSQIQSFNVSFDDKAYDETWAAFAVADHIGTNHTVLKMQTISNSYEHVAKVLLQSGQPYADTSLFAASALCQLMHQHITVALSGDGGDEIFGGYGSFWRIQDILRIQSLPSALVGLARISSPWIATLGILPDRFVSRFDYLSSADDVGILTDFNCWVRRDEHANLLQPERGLLPVERWFEPEWDIDLPASASRLEKLSAHTTEVKLRLVLASDYLFKMDTASMASSLEVRVPMLDEELVSFGLCLPHSLKVNGRSGKRVLRSIAQKILPDKVARKPKQGFGVPVDLWLGNGFREALADVIRTSSSQLNEYFRPEVYLPWVDAFYRRQTLPNISRAGLYQRVIMLLSFALTLQTKEKD